MPLASTLSYSAVSVIKNAMSWVTCPSVTGPHSPAGCERAWDESSHDTALEHLEMLAGELARSHPGAVGSLREGMAETVTIQRLGVTGSLTRTICSTNPIESMIECVRRTARDVKR